LLLSLSDQKNIQRLYEATNLFTSSTRLHEDCSIEKDGMEC
jgi:hypothetical protein